MYKKGHIHFVGIGGIGMSGLAKILRSQGYTISGCDLDVEQQTVVELINLGCEIFKGNDTNYCDDNSINVLVYSSAIDQNNPEIKRAQSRSIAIIPRALMLAELMRTKYSIAISGSHGKTTTTSLISHILIEAKKDPTIIIGGILKNLSTNAQIGNGDFLVAEADESDRSFLKLYPTLAIVTNIDHEHLDTYRDINDIKETFIEFLSNLPFYGKAIVCIDDPNIQQILPLNSVNIIKYGIDHPEANIFARSIDLQDSCSTFDVYLKDSEQPLGSILLNMPGRHNILNALAAIATALDLDIAFDVISNALKSFKGVERRFSFKSNYNGAEIYDDYGHHPTEIFNTLLVARKKAKKKLIVIFQPQRYTRTQKLWEDFVNVLAYSPIDQLIITDIYPASEKPIENINSQNLVDAIKKKQPSSIVQYITYDKSLESISNYLKPLISENDLILTLGAGKVNKLSDVLE